MPLIQGKISYAKILGKPRPGYDKIKNEWSFDLCLDEKGLAEAKRLGFSEKVKNKNDGRGPFVSFKRSEFKFKEGGEPVANQPFKVVDHHGKPWDQKVIIGNGSTVNVKYNVYPGRKGNKPVALAIQVWNHIPFEADSNDFPVDIAQGSDDFTAAEENE